MASEEVKKIVDELKTGMLISVVRTRLNTAGIEETVIDSLLAEAYKELQNQGYRKKAKKWEPEGGAEAKQAFVLGSAPAEVGVEGFPVLPTPEPTGED